MMCGTSTGTCHEECAVAANAIDGGSQFWMHAWLIKQSPNYKSLHFTFMKICPFQILPIVLERNPMRCTFEISKIFILPSHHGKPSSPNTCGLGITHQVKCPIQAFFSSWNFVWTQYWKQTLKLGDNPIEYNYSYGSINPARLAHSYKSRDCIWFHKNLCLNGSRTDFQMIWKSVWWNSGKGVHKVDCCPEVSFRAFDCPKTQSKMVPQYGVQSCLLLFNTTTTFQTGYISVETIWISQYGITYIIWLPTLNVEFF